MNYFSTGSRPTLLKYSLSASSFVSKLYSNIRVLVAVLMKLKEPIVQKLSNCYGMFSEAYDRICKKEEDDER